MIIFVGVTLVVTLYTKRISPFKGDHEGSPLHYI